MSHSIICSPKVTNVSGDFFTHFNFEAEEVIHTGKFGEIVLANSKDKTHVRRVVKKFTLLDAGSKARNQRAFQAEVQFMQSFDHPRLTKCMLAAQCPDYLAICMPYYSRGTLDWHIGHLNLELSEMCVSQLAKALKYLHEKHVAHCDVKLNNIFVDAEFNIYLGDFRSAIELSPQQNTVAKSRCGGTPFYNIPETIRAPSHKLLDPFKMDVFCLGVVFWALVMRTFPGRRTNYIQEAQKNEEIPTHIKNLLQKILEENPVKRPSVSQFLNKFKHESGWASVAGNKTKWNKVVISLGRQCREWARDETEEAIQDLLRNHSGPQDVIIYTDGSVNKKLNKSGWGFIAYKNGRRLAERAAAYRTSTSVMNGVRGSYEGTVVDATQYFAKMQFHRYTVRCHGNVTKGTGRLSSEGMDRLPNRLSDPARYLDILSGSRRRTRERKS